MDWKEQKIGMYKLCTFYMSNFQRTKDVQSDNTRVNHNNDSVFFKSIPNIGPILSNNSNYRA